MADARNSQVTVGQLMSPTEPSKKKPLDIEKLDPSRDRLSIKPRTRLTTEELKKKLEFEARMLEQKDQVLREMRET